MRGFKNHLTDTESSGFCRVGRITSQIIKQFRNYRQLCPVCDKWHLKWEKCKEDLDNARLQRWLQEDPRPGRDDGIVEINSGGRPSD